MGCIDKDDKVVSSALLNHNDSLEIRCGEDSMVVSICELQWWRNLNALGFCSFHRTFATISGAILSVTNNSMTGGKLQMCDEKRFEQPQLGSSQSIGAIGLPFEAIGKRFSLSPNCSGEVWEVKLQWTELTTRTKFQWRESR
jgi:hypothetical protein